MTNRFSFIAIVILLCGFTGCQKSETVLKLKANSFIDAQPPAKKLTDTFTFMLDVRIKEENSVVKKTDLLYPYYQVVGKPNKIAASLYLDNQLEDSKIQLIALQGNKIARMKHTEQQAWHRAMDIPIPQKARGEINFFIEWDTNGSEELIIFPIKYQNPYSYMGAHPGVVRLFLGKEDRYGYSEEILEKYAVPTDTKGKKLVPSLSWVDETQKTVLVHVNKNNQPYIEKETNKLSISELAYDTSIDLLYVSELGEIEVLQKRLLLKKNEVTLIEIPETKMNNYGKKRIRQFLFIINHRDEQLIQDYLAVSKGYKMQSTNFQQVIEIYPTKDSLSNN